MMKLAGAVAVAGVFYGGVADAAAPIPIVRGRVTAVSDSAISMRTNDGHDVTIPLTSSTNYDTISKSSLAAITKDTFIGTAAKDAGSQQVALEVVVFPNTMRGTGEGHYGWDPLPDVTTPGGQAVASTMTNGTVAATSGAPTVATTMTNGTVSGDANNGGAAYLTVTYKGGEQKIVVLPSTPIVAVAPAQKSDLSQGDAVVVLETKDNTAALIMIGVNGVTPPM